MTCRMARAGEPSPAAEPKTAEGAELRSRGSRRMSLKRAPDLSYDLPPADEAKVGPKLRAIAISAIR